MADKNKNQKGGKAKTDAQPTKAGKRKPKPKSAAPQRKQEDAFKLNLDAELFLVKTLNLDTLEVDSSKVPGAEVSKMTPDDCRAPMFAWFKKQTSPGKFFTKIVFLRPHRTGCPYRVKRDKNTVNLFLLPAASSDSKEPKFIRTLEFGEFPEEVKRFYQRRAEYRKPKGGFRTGSEKPEVSADPAFDKEFAAAMGEPGV